MRQIELHVHVPVPPARLYADLLDAERLGDITGTEARIVPEPGSAYALWDGHVTGRVAALEEPRRIALSWRTANFPPGHPDASAELVIEAEADGRTRLTVIQDGLPPGLVADTRQGWLELVFTPMQEYYTLHAPGRGPGVDGDGPPR